MENGEYKKCPFCSEDIMQVAIKCKHCKSDLSGAHDIIVKQAWIEPQVQLDHRCPKCNISLQEGVKLCGNCKAQLTWRDGQPRFTAAYTMQQVGCAVTSLGCLIPILIVLVALMMVFFSM